MSRWGQQGWEEAGQQQGDVGEESGEQRDVRSSGIWSIEVAGRLTGWQEFFGGDICGFEKLRLMLQHYFVYENHKEMPPS